MLDSIAAETKFTALGPFGVMLWKVSDLGMKDGLYQCSAVEQHYTEAHGRRFQHLSMWAEFSADEIRAGKVGHDLIGALAQRRSGEPAGFFSVLA